MKTEQLEELRYAERNLGRNFITGCADDTTHNPVVRGLLECGHFRDGGPSTFGRWCELTPSGRAALACG